MPTEQVLCTLLKKPEDEYQKDTGMWLILFTGWRHTPIFQKSSVTVGPMIVKQFRRLSNNSKDRCTIQKVVEQFRRLLNNSED
jgi:hypothetical protein